MLFPLRDFLWLAGARGREIPPSGRAGRTFSPSQPCPTFCFNFGIDVKSILMPVPFCFHQSFEVPPPRGSVFLPFMPMKRSSRSGPECAPNFPSPEWAVDADPEGGEIFCGVIAG